MSVTRTTLDGVPLLMAPAVDGRIAGGMIFRVGQAHENLAIRGISHLCEHLALHELAEQNVHHNGETGDVHTQFFSVGSAAKVTEFFRSVCQSLTSPPLARLEVEKAILETEGASRSGNALRIYRFGARGFGLAGYPELGLPNLGVDHVRHWLATFFTRGNAIAWLAADEIPPGLRIELADGPLQPLPQVTNELPRTPAWIPGSGGPVVVNGLVPRRVAGRVFTQVVDRAVFRDLRQKGGYSYQAGADYSPLNDELASVTVVADVLDSKRDAVSGAMVDSLARLRWGGITQQEFERAREDGIEALSHPQVNSLSLPSRALDELLGVPENSVEEALAKYEVVTLDDVQQASLAFHESALAQMPVGELDWAGFSPAPSESEAAVFGQHHPSRSAGDDSELVIGLEGVSLVHHDKAITVRYQDLVAMQAFADGGRRLYGADGFTVAIEPTVHSVPANVVADVDAAAGPWRTVHLPARAADELHEPATETGRVRRGVAYAAAGLTTAMALVLVVIAKFADPLGVPAPGLVATLLGAVASLVVAYLLWGWVRRDRQGRANRR